MELTSADRLIWGVWSFIALIAYLRWCGTREDEKKARPPELAKRRERQNGTVEFDPVTAIDVALKPASNSPHTKF